MDAVLYAHETRFADKSFPLKAYSYWQNDNRNHYHDFYELVIVLKGNGQHIAAGKSYPISRGDVFVIKPLIPHFYQNTSDLEIENILFIPEKLNIPQVDIRDIPGYFALFDVEPMLRQKQNFKSRLTINSDQLSVVSQLIIELRQELKDKNKGFRFVALTHFMRLIAYLSRCYSHSTQEHSQKLLQISSMIDFIEANSNMQITLEDIANKGNMSIRTANRIFKDVLEITPIDYLIKTRINNAKSLLRNQKCFISEVAFKTGFNDSNYFSNQFKKFTGMSPRAYKKLESE